MKLIPITNSLEENSSFLEAQDCPPIIEAMMDYYQKIGYNFPWVGYFAIDENGIPVGTGGFKGVPNNGKIEIAYHTFGRHEGKGIGTAICKELVSIAQNSNPSVLITARTLPVESPSCSILRKNGFTNLGVVIDPEDGEVFEWVIEKPIQP